MAIKISTENKPAPGVPFFTPAQTPPAGSAEDPASAPTVFQPLRIRSVQLHNRFVVSPLCQYSAEDGHLTDYHLVHLGQFALHGAGLVFVEATAVEPRGRISLQDSGLWADSQIAPLRRITDFIHSQGSKVGIQLAHAGRKASLLAPWVGERLGKRLHDKSVGGWDDDVVAPSAIPFAAGYASPRELTVAEIRHLVGDFARAAERAVEAGFDTIEIHGAHGYLINTFLSPLSNTRTDEYGGSFENRIRFLQEVVEAVRAVIPTDMPLWLRISSTEWMEWSGRESWTVKDSIRLARLLPDWGVDVLDVSSGGNHSDQMIPFHEKAYQTDKARVIRRALRADGIDLLIGNVGLITEGETARDLVQQGPDASGDLVIVGRQFLRQSEWILKVAQEIKVLAKWPVQYHEARPRTDFGNKL